MNMLHIKHFQKDTIEQEVIEDSMANCKTLAYYDINAKDFVTNTVNADIEDIQNKFIELIPKQAYILDFGCGSGRDTKIFLEKGYRVDATDGSEELCKIASAYTGINVQKMLFQELDSINKYDAIWACSSILHLSKVELKNVLEKMCIALTTNGIIYTSFKYGEFEGERNGRYFIDMTETTFAELIKNISALFVEEQWITNDARPERGEEKWLNLILRKQDIQ